ncbi:MAG: hypothetical protein IJZ23_09045 [Roseburia sp.]|nr:hypothetical protein [Roseburia sp.]
MVEKLQQNKKVCTAVVLLLAILFMTVTNFNKTFQGGDSITSALHWNSENLVYNAMVLSYQHGSPSAYGLSDMYPYNGTYAGGLTNEELNFENGYCTTDYLIAVGDNEITQREYAVGNTIIFYSGDKADVVENYSENGYLFVRYEADEIFSWRTQGDLKYVVVYNNEESRYMQMGENVPYESQIGLQGKAFSTYPKAYSINEITPVFKWALAFLFATVISLICYGIYKKYNLKFAVVFYAVSLLAPWMIGYSTNLYWVEFTWFLPMLVGIYCANHMESKKARMISYVGVMLAIALKSACGYEYISTIMLSSIIFLLADFTIALLERKDKEKIKRLFWTIFWMGIFALLGFVIALVYHAYLRGAGNIFNGLKSIYLYDVLRRTLGGDPSMFQDVYADSLNASILRVLIRYLRFDTPLIFGVPGILFIPLIMVSFFTLVHAVWKKKDHKDMLALYIWMGIASVSWFVLGKSHSYIHTSMNFVMWYFGYMQIAFYVVVELACGAIKKVKEKKRINEAR